MLLLVLILHFVAGLRVGIIGGGISGAFLSHWIRSHSDHQCSKYDIIVYERNGRLGGRLHSVVIQGKVAEAGGSIGIEANKYYSQIVDELGLTKKTESDGKGVGIFDGESVVWETKASMIRNIISMLYRYGFAMKPTQKQVKALVESFDGFYALMKDGRGFKTPEEFWGSVGLYNYTKLSFRDELNNVIPKSWFISNAQKQRFIHEFGAGVTRVNYNQDTTLVALAGLVAFAGTDFPAFMVKEGNQKMVEKLFEKSNAQINLSCNVTKISKTGEKYTISMMKEGKLVKDEFDIVVIATPLEHSGIVLEPYISLPPRKYQRVITTFVSGNTRNDYFNKKSGDALPGTILTAEGTKSKLPFTSFALNSKLDENRNLYKFFSQEKIPKAVLDSVFAAGYKLENEFENWAYPQFNPPEKFAPIQLSQNLYYSNAVENGASAIEIMAVSANNIANLICPTSVTKDEL